MFSLGGKAMAGVLLSVRKIRIMHTTVLCRETAKQPLICKAALKSKYFCKGGEILPAQ